MTDILRDAGIGLWAVEIYADHTSKMFADETLASMLGMPEECPVEEAHSFLFKHAGHDSFDRIYNAFKKMMDGGHHEVVFPWHFDGDHFEVGRFGGQVNRKYKDFIRIEGTFQFVREMPDMGIKDRLATGNIIRAFAQKYDAAFLGNLNTGGYVMLANKNKTLDRIEKPKMFIDAVRQFVNDYVHPYDKKYFFDVLAKPESAKELFKVGETSGFEYRSNTTGEYLWHRANINRISDSEVLVGFENCDSDVLNRVVTEKLVGEYDAIYFVDLDRNEIRTARPSKVSSLGVFNGRLTYSDLIRKFSAMVSPEYRHDCLNFSDVSFVKRFLSKEDHREYIYELPAAKNKLRRFTIDVVERNEGEASTALFSFVGIDDLSAKTFLMQRKMAEQKILLDYFVESYSTAYSVDLTNDSVEVLHMDKAFCQIYKEGGTREDMTRFINRHIHPDDRELMFKLVDKEYIIDRLRKESSFTFGIRELFGGKERTMKGLVIRGIDEYHVAVGFMDITDELRREKELEEKAESADKFIENFTKAYNIAFKVNLSDDSSVVLRMDDDIVGNEKSFEKFSIGAEFFLQYVVYEKDRGLVRSELDFKRIRERIVQEETYSVDFRAFFNGITQWNVMTISALDKDVVAIGFAKRDKEVILRHLQEKMNADYFGLFAIDLDAETISMLKVPPRFYNAKVGMILPYAQAIEKFAAPIQGAAKDFLDSISDIENVKKMHMTEDKSTFSYQSQMGDEKRWVSVTAYVIARHDDGSPAVITLGLSFLDTLGSDRQELMTRIAEQNNMLEEQHAQIQEALSMAQSANRAKTIFLNNMSHDIRTPMNAIIGFTGLASSHIDDKELVSDYLGKISQSSDHLLSLINDVLDMSRIESGKIHLEEKKENLPTIIRTLRNIVQADVDAKNIDLVVDCVDVNDEEIICDKLRLNQVILNVLSNAIKYTQNGGTVSLRVRETGRKDKGAAYYEFIVKDNGIGMTKEFLETIFDPFTRAKSSTVSGIQGTGLGMSITKNIVEMMGGRIEVKSAPGKGTEVAISLVFKLPHDSSTVKPADTVASVTVEYDFSGKKILLVEDNELNREIATAILEESGCIVTPAEDGDIAVEKVKAASDGEFDLVLMDIQMPTLNGLDATRQIRALGTPISRIPIIAMTANAFEEDRKAALDAGMNEHVAKPINVQQLKKVLARFL